MLFLDVVPLHCTVMLGHRKVLGIFSNHNNMQYNIYTYVGDVNKFRQSFQAPFSAFETMHEEYIKYSSMGATLISSSKTQMGFEYEMLLDGVTVTINLYIND